MKRLLTSNPISVATGWIGVYMVIAIFPLVALLLHPVEAARGFWLEFSVGLGFVAIAMMSVQFVIAARVNRIEASYGVDILVMFHRYSSLAAFCLVVAHPLLLFIFEPDTRALLNIFEAPWRARLAIAATTAFALMVITTIWRQRLHIPYEAWRALHTLLAVLAVGLSFGHMLGVSHYLSTPSNLVIWGGIMLVALWLVLYTRIIKPLLMTRKPYEVAAVNAERGKVWALTLRPVGHPGFTFQPGQFAWLTLDISPLSMREHPFSMSSSGDQAGSIEFGIKALGDFTREIEHVKPGTRAYLDGPYGVFTTERYWSSAGFVMIAGGVGITPIYSMLLTAAERGNKHPFLLIYAAPSWEEITYRESLEALKTQIDLTLVYVLKEAPAAWTGETGYVDQDLLARYLPAYRGSRQYFICASPVMMDTVEKALLELGAPLTHVHMEHFNLA